MTKSTNKKPTTSSLLRDNSKAMYQPWRNEAFLADEFVQAMTPIQRWMYRTLLQSAFTCAERPNLPNEDSRLWALAGCESPEQWKQNKEVIRARFTPVTVEGKKVLQQKKVLEDWERMSTVQSSRHAAAKIAGLASAAKRQRDVDQTSANRQPNGDEPSTEFNQLNLTELNRTEPNRTEENGIELKRTQPTKPTNRPSAGGLGGSVGRSIEPTNPSKDAGKANDGLSGWRLDLQRKVQKAAADKEPSIVLAVPLPDTVFSYVEQMAENCGMDQAQDAVVRWLEARSFSDLMNPNVAWAKMPAEIYGFVS